MAEEDREIDFVDSVSDENSLLYELELVNKTIFEIIKGTAPHQYHVTEPEKRSIGDKLKSKLKNKREERRTDKLVKETFGLDISSVESYLDGVKEKLYSNRATRIGGMYGRILSAYCGAVVARDFYNGLLDELVQGTPYEDEYMAKAVEGVSDLGGIYTMAAEVLAIAAEEHFDCTSKKMDKSSIEFVEGTYGLFGPTLLGQSRLKNKTKNSKLEEILKRGRAQFDAISPEKEFLKAKLAKSHTNGALSQEHKDLAAKTYGVLRLGADMVVQDDLKPLHPFKKNTKHQTQILKSLDFPVTSRDAIRNLTLREHHQELDSILHEGASKMLSMSAGAHVVREVCYGDSDEDEVLSVTKDNLARYLSGAIYGTAGDIMLRAITEVCILNNKPIDTRKLQLDKNISQQFEQAAVEQGLTDNFEETSLKIFEECKDSIVEARKERKKEKTTPAGYV